MVVMFLPATLATGTEQERRASPSTCTVQAPHCAMPQPNFVPVSPRISRKNQSKGMAGETFTSCLVPLTMTCMTAILVAPGCASTGSRLVGGARQPRPGDRAKIGCYDRGPKFEVRMKKEEVVSSFLPRTSDLELLHDDIRLLIN